MTRCITGKRWVRLVLAAALLAGLGLGGVWWWTPGAGPFVAGSRLVYQVELTSAGHTDFSRALQDDAAGAAGQPRNLYTSVRGELVIDVLASGKDGAELLVRLRRGEVHFVSDGALNPDLARSVESDLKKPLLVEAAANGRVRQVWLAEGMSSASAGFARSVVSCVQFVWPQGAEAAWEVGQDDPAGTAQVRYERSGASVRLRRLRYQPPEESPGPDEVRLALGVEPEGCLTATVNVSRRQLLTLEGTEATTMTLDQKVVGRNETNVSLSLLRVERLTEKQRGRRERERSALREAGTPGSLVNPSPGEDALQRAELGEHTAEDLLAELDRVGPKGETALYLKFRALVWLQPAQAKRLAERLLRAKAGSPALRILTQALGLSGRPEAQGALAGVARARKDDWPIMAEILPTLGMTRRPGEEVDRVLAEIAQDGRDWNTRSTAQLALGTLARTLGRRAPRRAAAIVRWASKELASARTAREKRQFLLVLGNTALPGGLPAIRGMRADADPGVRGAALLALRWHAGEDVEVVLCEALLTDGDENVRLQAAGALEVRQPTPRAVAALTQALGRDPAAGVRLAALAQLAGLAQEHPQAAEAILQAAGHDPTPEVREAAAAAAVTRPSRRAGAR
jgi:hypothetical protein